MARLALFQELHEAMQARQQQQQYTSSGIDGSGSGRAAKPGGRAITVRPSCVCVRTKLSVFALVCAHARVCLHM